MVREAPGEFLRLALVAVRYNHENLRRSDQENFGLGTERSFSQEVVFQGRYCNILDKSVVTSASLVKWYNSGFVVRRRVFDSLTKLHQGSVA